MAGNSISDNISLTNIQFAYSVQQRGFLFVDPLLPAIFGIPEVNFTPAEIMSRIFKDDVDILQEAYQQVIEGTFSGSIKIRLHREDSELWINVTPMLGDTPAGKLIAGNVSDITAEVHNTEAIAKYTHKKNSILHMLAHELRGPLHIANSLIQVLNKEVVDEATLTKTGYLSEIIQDSINLIVDLTDREFLDTVEVALVKKRIDIIHKLQQYLEECRRSSHMTERSFNLAGSKPTIYLEVDEAKFMQIINNLITNAMKFTSPGGAISILVEERPESVLISFSDDGIGIPDQLLPLIFDQFTAARRPGLNGEPTFGLGLSIVKTIIDWHNGNIYCESIENQGTTFFIEFPN